jgi:hypothetical protein
VPVFRLSVYLFQSEPVFLFFSWSGALESGNFYVKII